MTAEQAVAVLRAHKAALCERGVARAAIFGSTARDQATSSSDIDVLVEIDGSADIDLYAYVGITQLIASLFSQPVDVADRDTLLEPVRREVERDALYAF